MSGGSSTSPTSWYFPYTSSQYSGSTAGSALGIDGDGPDTYCSLIGAGTTLIGSKLYLSGGVTTLITSNNGNKFNHELNDRIMNVDLSQAQDWNKPRISAAQKAESIPSLYIETLFRGDPSSSKLYSVNGVYQQASSQAPYSYRKTALTDPKYRAPPDKYTQVYSYDTKTGVWALEKMGGDQVLRVSHGQGTNDGRGVSYYLDGSTGADQDSSITDGGYYYFPGLLEFDWRNMQIRNHTHTMTPQSRGFLQYVPLGSKGVLLAFGGRNFQPAVNKPTNTLKSMGEISVFDIDTKTWHKQIAVPGSSSNTLPPGRSSGCSVVMSAPDGTSHNIYMYSGSSVYYDGGKRYNDLWVLSLPSFTWTNIFTENSTSGISYHRCEPYGRYMIATSGYREEKPAPFGNCTSLISAMDLQTGKWVDQWDGEEKTYQIPAALSDVIGGDASGGATILKPSGGWASPELEKVFSAKFDAALLDSAVGSQADTTESPPNISGSGSGGLSGGAIAGIVIGAIFGVAIVVLGILFLYRRTRKKRIAGDIQEIGSAAAIHRENKELPDSGIVEMEGDLSKEMPAVVPHELEGSAGANSTDRKVGCQSGRGV